MEQIVAGDEQAFREFYRRHSPLAMALCLKILVDRADAEDVLADVFCELWQKSANYSPSKGAPYTYLMILTRSRAIDQLRKRGRTPVRPASGGAAGEYDPTADVCAETPGPADRAEAQEVRRVLRALLDELPPQQREPLQLSFYQGLTHREIAAETGLPLGTVKSNIRTAFAKLRAALRNLHD